MSAWGYAGPFGLRAGRLPVDDVDCTPDRPARPRAHGQGAENPEENPEKVAENPAVVPGIKVMLQDDAMETKQRITENDSLIEHLMVARRWPAPSARTVVALRRRAGPPRRPAALMPGQAAAAAEAS